MNHTIGEIIIAFCKLGFYLYAVVVVVYAISVIAIAIRCWLEERFGIGDDNETGE